MKLSKDKNIIVDMSSCNHVSLNVCVFILVPKCNDHEHFMIVFPPLFSLVQHDERG